MTSTPPRRLLLVHAHPDDETIGNGATMARYAAEGTAVTLVTCTRGEQGEVIPPELAHLAPEHGEGLGAHREVELAGALAALGVADHVFLGAPGVTFRDSGMAYGDDGAVIPAPDAPPGAFALADVDQAARLLADVVRRRRPHVVVTYEPGGGYGHPDHIQTHRVTMRALDVAGDGTAGAPGWAVPKVYWTAIPRSLVPRPPARPGRPPDPMPSLVVDDDLVTTRIDAGRYRVAKVAAMRAHATQMLVDPAGTTFALSNGVVRPIAGVEYYRLVRGSLGADRGPDGREADLFAGLDPLPD